VGFFTKDIKTMNDLFMHGLQDLYYAENQIAKSLPDMIEKATNPQLRAGFEKQRERREVPGDRRHFEGRQGADGRDRR
jgi:ferritin-like metal-binding protein YciE